MTELEEANLLLRYAMSGSGRRWEPDAATCQRYVDAVHMQVRSPHRLDELLVHYPMLLGGLDAATRFVYRNSVLRAKIIVALALAEYHMASAEWLLPQERSLLRWIAQAAVAGSRLIAKVLLGLMMLSFSGSFVRRNAGL